PDKRVTIRLSKPVDRADLTRLGTVVSADAAQAVISVPAAQASAVVRDALATLPIVDLAIEEPPIEDVMRELFHTHGRDPARAPPRAQTAARGRGGGGEGAPAGAAGAAPPPRRSVVAELAHAVKAFPTLMRIGVAEVVAYRAEFLVWILTTNMPLVMLALWHA